MFSRNWPLPLAHWLVELKPARANDELVLLVYGIDRVRAWFAPEVEKFERQGAIAQ